MNIQILNVHLHFMKQAKIQQLTYYSQVLIFQWNIFILKREVLGSLESTDTDSSDLFTETVYETVL